MALASKTESSGTRARNAAWSRIALHLVLATLAYNVAEAAIALWSGMRAGSIALIGFGLDSVIETSAATLLVWRLIVETSGSDRDTVERTERSVQRFVGLTFLMLAVYVTVQASWTLWSGFAPDESLIGVLLAAVSSTVMPLLAWWKLRAAREIGSNALRAEAKETLACSYLSATLLFGLVANATLGWWQADPYAALLMVPWLLREGIEGLRGGDRD
jgi:divalent metal cation (Fe/Co/Zn/Cd) transporter